MHAMFNGTKFLIIITLALSFALAVSAQGQCTATEKADSTSGFVSLFDGETLDGWTGAPSFWRVEEGNIIAETTPDNRTEHNTFLIWTGGEVADFELKFRYRQDTPWVNSGVQFRSERLDGHRVKGYQADISTEDWIPGIFYEERGRSVLARRGQRLTIAPDGEKEVVQFKDETELLGCIHADDWNEYHIIARGNHFVSYINGCKMHEVTDNAPEARASGILAFQLHASAPMRIRFADIMLKNIRENQASSDGDVR